MPIRELPRVVLHAGTGGGVVGMGENVKVLKFLTLPHGILKSSALLCVSRQDKGVMGGIS